MNQEYQQEFMRYESTKEQATKLLCNYLNPRRDIDCDEEIIEIIDLFFEAIASRIKCINLLSQLEIEECMEHEENELE
ncbi:hypothetical protein [Myxosarcina sp. GI1]|uniref:hypothetical protein n=1 Tax=Myxosarcina sp. GI1 TaxID=1541065 RepID=UPI00056D7ADA|nr:hypothetical protein [Myxosarcina sp. GI1]